MFNVVIDTKAISDQYTQYATAIVNRTIDRLGEFALTQIRSRTDRMSIESQEKYIKALKTNQEDGLYEIYIDDPHVSAIEQGFNSFDMKPGLLAGKTAKQSKDGQPIVDVPFQHKITKRGPGLRVEAKSMKSVIKAAEKEVRKTGQVQRVFKRQKGMLASKRSDMKVALSNLAGEEKVTLKTFRRISENSAPDKWIHPGSKGTQIFKEVVDEIEKIKDSVMQDVIKEL